MKIGYFTLMFLCSLFLHLVGFSAPPPIYCIPSSVNGNQIDLNKVWRIKDLKLARLSVPDYGIQAYSFLDVQDQYELFQGRGYKISLTTSVINPDQDVNSAYTKIWIDFNGDGNFDNNGEVIMDLFGGLGSQYIIFAVPSNAYTGDAVRMRIAIGESNIGSACNDIQSGVMVDYSLKIHSSTEGQSADGYCLPVENYPSEPISILELDQAKLINGATNFSYKEVNYDAQSFQAGIMHSINLVPAPPNDGVKEFFWRVWLDLNGKNFDDNELVFEGVSDINGIAGMVSIPQNATGKAKMRVSLGQPVLSGSCSYVEYGQIIDFDLAISHEYCTNFKNSSNYYIEEFSTSTYSNFSGPGPYSDYTSSFPFKDMYCVSSWTYGFSVKVKTPANPFAYVTAAIDFNHDNLFSNDEIVVPSTVISGNQLVSLPAFKACNPNMITGKTRLMIVASKYVLPPDFDFCNFGPEMDGEVEDYTINLGSIIDYPLDDKLLAKETIGEIMVYPNPAKESVKWTAPVADGINYELSVTDFMGTPVLRRSGIGSGGAIDVSGFSNGIYLIVIKSEDGTSYRGRISVSK